METAANPQFRHSLLHSHMFQYHVLADTSLPNPGFLPYYPEAFFQTIKHVHENTPLNVKTMTISQWTRILTEDCLTMEQVPNKETLQYIPCRSELASPHNDWHVSWNMCRMRGLNSEMTSFNFKLLHQLLPVKNRLHQITPATQPTCTLCTNSCPETLQHALLSCSYNDGTGQVLLTILQSILPGLSSDELLLLQFPNLPESKELATIFLTSSILFEIWSNRCQKKRITLFDIRSTLEAKCSLLRETRYSNTYETLKDFLENM